jgi:hypothetical protein
MKSSSNFFKLSTIFVMTIILSFSDSLTELCHDL